MVLTRKLTPETLVSAPRRGAAVPSPDGKLAFFPVSTHTIGESTLKETKIMSLDSGNAWRVSDDDKIHDVSWVPGDESNQLVWLKSAEKGATEVHITDARKQQDSYLAGTISGAVDNLKMVPLDDGSVAFVVVGLVADDGNLHNTETSAAKSTGRVYDSWHVREWDTYVSSQKYALWYSRLSKFEGQWRLTGPLQNALAGSDLEAPDQMYEPGDGSNNFDVSQKGILFVAQDPREKNVPRVPEAASCSDVYFIPMESFTEASQFQPIKVVVQGDDSFATKSNPRFSPDGSMIAFIRSPLQCPVDGRLMVGHTGSLAVRDVFKAMERKPWHLTPSSLEFSPDGKSLLVQADECGRTGLYELDLHGHSLPKPIVRQYSVSAFYPIKGDGRKLLVSGSNLVSSHICQIVEAALDPEAKTLSTSATHGNCFGLSHSKQVSEIYFEGAGDYCVQAWVVKPSDFDETKKYPLVLMIHGGPNGSWGDAWSNRWNPVAWAEQGYIVVAPNVTGSTGFGVDFAAGVYGSWGGRPYQDLVNCMEYLKNILYIDLDRAVAAGGSYGGYMICWINGNPLGRKFKATVCHDCVFNTAYMTLNSDECGSVADFEGPAFPWSNYDRLMEYNPARPDKLANWKHAPPSLVIHSDQDFRCPATEGLAAFRTLQMQGVPSRYLAFPDENHWVLKEENSLQWHQVVFDWINKYTGVADENTVGMDRLSLIGRAPEGP